MGLFSRRQQQPRTMKEIIEDHWEVEYINGQPHQTLRSIEKSLNAVAKAKKRGLLIEKDPPEERA